MKKLLLIDAYAQIFRAYYAMIRNPRFTTGNLNTSAIFGFVNTLQDLLKREQPSHIAVCFDPQGKTFRHEAYPQYKAQREATPEDIKRAVPYIKRVVEAYNIPIYEVEGYEADDVIGTLARQADERGVPTLMITGDKDFAQLVTDNVKIYNPGKQELLGVEEVKAKYGLKSPLQVIDMLGLMGDSADNIPGCPGVGPKTAEKLIQQYGSVEGLLAHISELKGAMQRNVRENVEQIRFSKFLATIKTDVPVTLDEEALRRRPINAEALGKVFDELEFRTLAKRVITDGEGNVGLDVPDRQNGIALSDRSDKSDRSDRSDQSGNPSRSATAKSGQGSLFDFGDAAPEPVAAVVQRTKLDTENAHYSIITDLDEAERYVAELLRHPMAGVYIVAEGEEAMRAQVLGFAFAADGMNAAYIPLDGFGWIMDAVSPVFRRATVLASNDVKRDMVMLRSRGVAYTAPYYDTAVAHYLIQPERGHDTAQIADELLHYDALSLDDVLGAKGRPRKSLDQLPPEKVMMWACERAELSARLPEALNRRLDEEGVRHLFDDIEQPLVEVLAEMELAGARIDVKALNEYSVVLTERMNILENECHRLAGVDFNTASPAQVGEVLFDRLKIDDKAKKTKTGQYSTTEDILIKLRDRHPVVEKILELRGIRKLLSTYVNALPALINPRTGRVHTTFNQTVTATGRLSSTNPNLQNIPVRSDNGREIRRAFIPADGNVFFSADYSQIELRLVADLSRDRTMLEAFAQDEDIHAITASKIYHIDLDKVTPDQRRKAKTANFGILYGISAFGLAERLNIPRAEAKMLIEGYFNTFPQVRDYIDRSIAEAKEKGYVTTLYGRRRMLPDINSRNAVVRSFSERNAINAPIQGTAADVIKRAMIAIFKRFRNEGIKSKMILQVHDELNFDVIPAELPRVEEIVVTEMERAYSGGVRLTASHATAQNWLDAH